MSDSIARKLAATGLVSASLAIPAPALAIQALANDRTPDDLSFDRGTASLSGGGVDLDQADFLQLGTRLADNDLGEMRGKFIRPDAVSYFGISMQTSWQDGQGVTTFARLAFNVDFLPNNGGGSPTLMVGWARDGGDDPAMNVAGVPEGYVALTLGPDQVMPVGALDTLAGAGQANIVAGADNAARNSLQVAVVPRSAVPDMAGAGLHPINATTGVSFSDGDQLQFRLGENSVGMVLTGNNGLDSSLQSVGGGLGQLLQQTMLQSDGNSVLNSATVVFGVDALHNAEAVRADGALMSMKGLGL